MERQVFISYASKELSKAQEVCDYLESNGISCWIAPRNIMPGAEYGEAIINGIENCKVFVLLYSQTSNLSQHVLREVERAVSKRVPLIAYKIEDAPLSKSMEYFLLTNQWLDATSKGNHLADLCKSIKQIVGDTKENIEEVEIHNKKSNLMTRRLIPTICASAGVIILIVVLSILLKDSGNKVEDEAVVAQTTPTAVVTVEATSTVMPTQETVNEESPSDENTTDVDENNQEQKTEIQNNESVDVPKDTTNVTPNDAPQTVPESNMKEETVVADNAGQNSENVNSAEPAKEETKVQLEVGEYISFGHYQPQGYKSANADDEIHWIIVNVDQEKKEAVLVSEKVLDMKPFDCAESGEFDKDAKGNSYDRSQKETYSPNQMAQFRGNSDWANSNIRTWLNSSAARVSYKDQAPVSKATDEHANSYDKQAGFLYNFSKAELNLLCDVKNTTTANAIGAEKADKPAFEFKPGLVTENYNLSKYASKTTTDKVYLLSLDEVKKYLDDNNLLIFANPTQSAVDSDQSSYYKAVLAYDTTYSNWVLRTPNGADANSVIVVGSGTSSKQDFNTYNASASGLGIRPAVTISLNGVIIEGDGTQGSPYTIK